MLTTTNAFGGKNYSLGIFSILTGWIDLILLLIFLILKKCKLNVKKNN